MTEKLTYEETELGCKKPKKEAVERMPAGQSLQEREEKFRLLAETTSEAILTCDLKENITYVNKACLELSGYSYEEVLERSITEVISANEHARVKENLAKHALPGSKTCRFEAEFINKGGDRVPVDVSMSLIMKHDKPSGLLIAVSDLSERKKTEEELLKVQKLESIGALAGGIAHDYNNILAVIIGNISLAQTYLEPGHKVFRVLTAAQRASEQAKNLTKRLLTFSKGGAPIRKVVSISSVIESAVDFTLSGSNVKCEFSIPQNLWPVEIDESQIGQAIYNVVVNSMEAMPEGGTLRVGADNIRIDLESNIALKEGKYLRISIEDHGTGVSEGVLEKIFDPYFSTKKMGAQKGMGLGLSISHSIIKRHGGDIEMVSEVGVGTTCFIYLPASEKETNDVKPAKRHMKEKPVAGRGRVLVMDDEEMIRKLCSQMLIYLGYEVALSKDGAEAIELYQKAMKSGRPFDVVILDLTVRGGIGGGETILKLAEIDPGVKGIVSSGYSDNPVISDYERYGFSGAIAKPYKVNELGRTLNRVIKKNSVNMHEPE
jgi:two-component system cell cycle sensor histidine kinase/response regulator CckA